LQQINEAMAKPQLPAGFRDFGPEAVYKRNYIFQRIREVFEQYGYQPLETPAFETTGTLTEKYGEEGDQLLYRVLNSGDYLSKVPEAVLNQKDSKALLPYISDKGLRYDLTVPMARYVAMNTNTLTFPFKRYQLQNVWRADKPQKGRYREFYQCDADVVGSRSLMYEAELITLFDAVFDALDLGAVTLELNSRKILMGLAKAFEFEDRFADFTIALDKLDKIGMAGVKEELDNRGIPSSILDEVQPVLKADTSYAEKLNFLESYFHDNVTGLEGLNEIKRVNEMLNAVNFKRLELNFNLTLARGLDYYTGIIFEAVPQNLKSGSIASGGRYDDLTAYFGLNDVSGIGISFGVERIYEVMDEQGLLEGVVGNHVQVMVILLEEQQEVYGFQVVTTLRDAGIAAEITPDARKLGKQLKYADRRQVNYALILNAENSGSRRFTLKHMSSGNQTDHTDLQTVKAELTA
jgi:histidyl-tRNA synthetase